MRKLYLFLLLCSVSICSFAQVVVTTNFTSSSWPPGWTETSGTGGANVVLVTSDPLPPYASPLAPSTYIADWESWSIGSGDNAYVTTPVIDWSSRAGAATSVTAYVYRDASYCQSTNDYMQVYVNTSNSLTGATSLGIVYRRANLATVAGVGGAVGGSSAPGSSGWFQYSFVVPTTFNSSTNYILFNFVSAYGADVNMDNVVYTTYSCASTITGGNTTVCSGSTKTLTGNPGGGSWSSSAPGTASVVGGVVTGVTPGSATITYTPTCGVGGNSTTTVTVIAAPAATTGNAPFNVCSTETLSDATGVGTWTSSNTAVATVGTASGASAVITGVPGAGGNSNITFTLTSSGCTNVTVVTVNAMPAITGTSTYCTGTTATLSNSIAGGTWTSSVPTQASIGSSSGLVTALLAGTPTITYSIAGGCSVTYPITVNTQPAAITGVSTICGGAGVTSVTLGDATAGGTWTSSNTAVATIGPSSGTATGVTAGSSTIAYTMPGGCFSSATLSVNAVAPITGLPSVCLGNSITLSDATGSGTWSSSNPSTASINSSGVLTGVALGTVSISYTVASLGCSAVTTENSTNPPVSFSVTGGGAYCAGGTGVHIGVNSSTVGVIYYLFNGATQVTTLTGTGGALDFGLYTAGGTYTVIANYGNPCTATMSGSAVVSVNPLPTAFSVGGGGAYCSGGTGVNVTLSSSAIGVNYQLMLGVTPIGSPIAGTGSSLNFGLQTTAGTYTVVATNATTSCVNTMSGSVVVSINTLPTSFSVTGGGGFCLGGSGVHIGLSGSATGVSYQLLISGSPVAGAVLSGTGAALDFGLITTAGLYTVLATNTATGCTLSMSGTVTITINPLPPVYTITGGGAYCFGGTGMPIGLNGSTAGVNYQLLNGSSPVGAPVAGTGVALTFGLQTTVGSYTIVATNAITGCVNNMFGSVSISTNPLPTVFSITGGGGYCAGGAGLHIGLSGSLTGTTYTLLNGATIVGGATGTGIAVDFGPFTTIGTYTAYATIISTGCVGNMSGSVAININPLPTIFTVTGGGNYCAGGTGNAVGLNGSTIGVNYQLYDAGVPVGPAVAGTGSPLNFGLQTGAGAYTVIATNATTTCTNNMSGSVLITINPLPTVYAITGGGGYCSGGTGVHVGLAASNSGISYRLWNSGTGLGSLPGTGFSLDFGLQTTAGTYTIIATDPVFGCTNTMGGSDVVSINALPTPYSVLGGGSYCAGGTGVHVTLGNSASGINYQLFNGITAVGSPVAGTGSSIDFGAQTVAGTYTVVATNATTLCSNNMTGSVTITVNPLPAVFAVTGGGGYCAGGTGLHIGLSGSVAGISYQLMNGLATVGLPVAGTGSALDFGLQTGAGTYTVVATNVPTTCTSNMTGSVTITVNPLPGLNTITGGGSYCAGGTGVHVGLNGSIIGISYQLNVAGAPVGSPMVGTGLALDFGLHMAAGTYTVTGMSMSTGCQSTMTGTTGIIINALPALHTMTGGGSNCVGGTGVTIGLDGSDIGVNYQLYVGTTPVGAAVPGTGSALSFGFQTTLGIYMVVASNTATGCTNNMTGRVAVGTYPLPVVYNVTGGGNYCNGGAGVHIGLSSSNTGISYQLWNGGLALGSIPGSGAALDFGLQAGAGTYKVIATSMVTGCTNNMNGSAVVGINPLPALHTITGGGDYCAGGTGVVIGLNGSDLGTNYQLFMTGPAGSLVAGTGSAISFGLQTVAGTYTVVATNTGTTCVNTMTGIVNVNIDPLPTAYALTGGGNYCSGGAGADIMLGNSDLGINYQLYNVVTMIGALMPGTGSPIDFGPQTAAGTYMVTATNTATGCVSNITGITININPLPTAFIVTGGGNYCAGGAGVHVMLSGSNNGIGYQLWNGGPVGPVVAGTGFALDFGLQTVGGTYTVKAMNSTTSCTNMMSGSATVVVNPLPNVYPVSSTSSTYCAGGSGVDIWLNTSDAGIRYQLYYGLTATGAPLAGTGSSIDFGNLFTAGSYTVVGINTATGCTNNMSSSVTIVVDPLPTAYTITGGGSYCAGTSGAHVGLSGSNVGILYQLLNGIMPVGSAVSGTGGVLDFGPQTTIGSYSVVASNPATTCVANMSGTVTVAVSPLPIVYTVTGGGNYCAGGTGMHVVLGNSTLGVNYQLYLGGLTAVGSPMAGSGTSLDFGAQTTAGTYTVVATNGITGCTNIMAGNAVVGINPAPAAWPVIGGGNFCPGGSGVHVGISGSSTGISYQLYNGTTAVGAAITGTGSSLDFGLQATPGLYTVIATNSATGCTAIMPGGASVVINALPTAYAVVGGGNYCAGGAGVHIGVANSQAGVNYTLINGFTTVTMIPGTGTAIDFGLQTAAGTYTVHAMNATTGCSADMSGSVGITVNPLVSPSILVSASPGDTVCEGTFTTFTTTTVNGGTSPIYQWTINGFPSGAGPMYSYIPLNGDVVGVILTSNASCATPTMVSASVTMAVLAHQTPAVSVSADPGTIVCQGTGVTLTATPSNGGTAPTYSWIKNTTGVSTASTFSYVPANGDVVYCTMTSNYKCRTINTATSNHLTMEVDVPIAPVVTITANPGVSIGPGQTETLMATVANGGQSPTFQWQVNGVSVPGATQPTFVSNAFNDGDVVTCDVTNSGGCTGMQGMNSVTIHVRGTGVQPVTSAGADIKLLPNPNKGNFTLKGILGTVTDEEATIEVTDMLGQQLYKRQVSVHNGMINEQVDMGGTIANGMYILNLRSGGDNKVFHLVIEQ